TDYNPNWGRAVLDAAGARTALPVFLSSRPPCPVGGAGRLIVWLVAFERVDVEVVDLPSGATRIPFDLEVECHSREPVLRGARQHVHVDGDNRGRRPRVRALQARHLELFRVTVEVLIEHGDGERRLVAAWAGEEEAHARVLLVHT